MYFLLLLRDNASLIFSFVALIVSVLGYRNSRAIKIKNDKDALYRLKIEALSKARESEITFQDIYDKISTFVDDLNSNNELPLIAKQAVLNELTEQRDSFFRQCVLDAKAASLYIIENFDKMDEKEFIEYHRTFMSELERLKANSKRLDLRFTSLINIMKLK